MQATQTEQPTRRTALGRLLWGTLALIAAPAVYVVSRYLTPPAAPSAMVVIGSPEAITATDVRIVKVGATDAAVMRQSNGELMALDMRCTHAGCSVIWQAQDAAFVCPCHGGRFDRDGAVVEGPPKLPLVRLELHTVKNQIVLTDIPLGGKVDNSVDKVRS